MLKKKSLIRLRDGSCYLWYWLESAVLHSCLLQTCLSSAFRLGLYPSLLRWALPQLSQTVQGYARFSENMWEPSKQMVLFGQIHFMQRKKISLRAHNLESSQLKVNDKSGNPIIIGAVVVWRVKDTFKAAFEVENYHQFVSIQSESAIRQLAGSYAYDNHEDELAQLTLREGSVEISRMLEKEISERVEIAGIEVIESRISHLSYAPEIANAMLQRQQAQAIVAARKQIVEGAVGMVEMALDQLSAKKVVEFDAERKAAMVSNLLVVLCSEKSAAPMLNAGS